MTDLGLKMFVTVMIHGFEGLNNLITEILKIPKSLEKS